MSASKSRPHAQRPRVQAERVERPAARKAQSEIVVGLRAGLAVFAARPTAIESVEYIKDIKSELTTLLKWCTEKQIPFREAKAHELERTAQTPLHEGLVVRAAERRWATTDELIDRLVRTRGTAVALDRVRNPYNIGAILRSAAFLGVDAALLGALAHGPALQSGAVRVAEGGAEHLVLYRTSDLAETLRRFRKRGGYVVGADGGANAKLIGHAFKRPSIIVMGHEREGLSERVRAQCDAIVAIEGTGAVESLNVAVAAGILFSELLRNRA